MIIKLYYKHCSHPIVLGASTLGLLDQPVRCHTSLVRGTCASTPREAADVLSAHVRSLLDRDREGDRRRQLPIVGNDLLGHGITHLLLKMLVTFHHMLKIKNFFQAMFWPGECRRSEVQARNDQQSNTSCRAQSCTPPLALEVLPPSPSWLVAPSGTCSFRHTLWLSSLNFPIKLTSAMYVKEYLLGSRSLGLPSTLLGCDFLPGHLDRLL